MQVTHVHVAGSERLLLRPLDEDDVAPVGAWIEDDELRRSYLVTDAAVPGEESIRGLIEWAGADHRVRGWAIEHRDWGLVAMGNWRPDLPFDWVYEIEVTLGPAVAKGRGLGTEAHRLVIDHLFRSVPEAEKVMGRIALFNEAMLAICPKIGATAEGRLRSHARVDGRPVDLMVVGILREEWERRGG